jgi:hypothetical protein
MFSGNFVSKIHAIDRPEGLGEKGLGKKQALTYENLRNGLYMGSSGYDPAA